jgi:hypothetical protein
MSLFLLDSAAMKFNVVSLLIEEESLPLKLEQELFHLRQNDPLARDPG